jgi:hypothetical protein
MPRGALRNAKWNWSAHEDPDPDRYERVYEKPFLDGFDELSRSLLLASVGLRREREPAAGHQPTGLRHVGNVPHDTLLVHPLNLSPDWVPLLLQHETLHGGWSLDRSIYWCVGSRARAPFSRRPSMFVRKMVLLHSPRLM